MQVKRIRDFKTLLASAARTATGNGDAVRLQFLVSAFAFVLDVTAAAEDVGDSLDVYVQTKIDGTNWLDVQHFTQVLGNGGTKRYVAKVAAGAALTEFETGAALGAAAKRDLIGDEWRVRWVIVDDAGTGSGSGTGSGEGSGAGSAADNVSFTFSVRAIPM